MKKITKSVVTLTLAASMMTGVAAIGSSALSLKSLKNKVMDTLAPVVAVAEVTYDIAKEEALAFGKALTTPVEVDPMALNTYLYNSIQTVKEINNDAKIAAAKTAQAVGDTVWSVGDKVVEKAVKWFGEIVKVK